MAASNCFHCTNALTGFRPVYTNHNGLSFCSEECILADHDMDEELHAFRTTSPATGAYPWECAECGDTREGLMHNNTDRNVEPLLWDGE